jgi:hypothetical protein
MMNNATKWGRRQAMLVLEMRRHRKARRTCQAISFMAQTTVAPSRRFMEPDDDKHRIGPG